MKAEIRDGSDDITIQNGNLQLVKSCNLKSQATNSHLPQKQSTRPLNSVLFINSTYALRDQTEAPIRYHFPSLDYVVVTAS